MGLLFRRNHGGKAAKDETPERRRRAAFAEMAMRHEADMLRTARRLTMGNEDRAQDLVQDALVRAYAAYLDGQFQEGGNARAWLLRIVTNLFINEYRRRAKWDAGVDVDTLTAGGEVGPASTHAAPDEVPDRALDRRTLDEPLERALAALPDPLRVTILLVDVEEYSYEEAARLLDVPVGTVRSRLSRARYQLQDRLRDYARDRRLTTGDGPAGAPPRGEVGA